MVVQEPQKQYTPTFWNQLRFRRVYKSKTMPRGILESTAVHQEVNHYSGQLFYASVGITFGSFVGIMIEGNHTTLAMRTAFFSGLTILLITAALLTSTAHFLERVEENFLENAQEGEWDNKFKASIGLRFIGGVSGLIAMSCIVYALNQTMLHNKSFVVAFNPHHASNIIALAAVGIILLVATIEFLHKTPFEKQQAEKRQKDPLIYSRIGKCAGIAGGVIAICGLFDIQSSGPILMVTGLGLLITATFFVNQCVITAETKELETKARKTSLKVGDQHALSTIRNLQKPNAALFAGVFLTAIGSGITMLDGPAPSFSNAPTLHQLGPPVIIAGLALFLIGLIGSRICDHDLNKHFSQMDMEDEAATGSAKLS